MPGLGSGDSERRPAKPRQRHASANSRRAGNAEASPGRTVSLGEGIVRQAASRHMQQGHLQRGIG